MSQTKDLPKPAADFKEELTHFDSAKLSHTDTVEKTPLAHDAMLYGVEHFQKDKLHHAQTQEKNILPGKEDVAKEKTHQNLLTGVESFDKTVMKPTETKESNPLTHEGMLYGVEHFKKDNLKHAKTQEKTVLPDTTAIAAEKSQQEFIGGIEQFDKAKLKHTETQEKIHFRAKKLLPKRRPCEDLKVRSIPASMTKT